ncbi:MAG: anaerobic ribonucleoside-triphosphate reductase activating protein [Treponema sp.]|nr:anaerobic ribonucleoside-triphosphate reductase activating protein [Treponema sp.]
MTNDVNLRIGGIESESIVDGPGFRYVVFVQGCCFSCEGCHNAALQSFEGGRIISPEEILASIKDNPLLSGLTLSGGEPFTQAAACANLAREVHTLGLSVMTYTGHTWEELTSSNRNDWTALIHETDILVDGPFVMELKNIGLTFRGSSNQRLIDVKKSLADGKVIEIEL